MELNPRGRVWMDARNILMQRPSKTLDWKYLGPYEISEVISPWAYRLNLPKDLHIHPVQPISCLSKVSEDALPRQIKPAPPPVIVNGKEEYEVEHIKDSRLFQCLLQYLVKQKGSDEKSREPASNVDGLQGIDIFHIEQPGKPGS
jgi:hypothetical protein